MWRAGLLKYDEEVGIEWEWQVMDSAMTKAPLGEEGTGPNPTDRGKKGTKRSLLTEGKGISLAVVVEGANRHDMKMVEGTLEAIIYERVRWSLPWVVFIMMGREVMPMARKPSPANPPCPHWGGKPGIRNGHKDGRQRWRC